MYNASYRRKQTQKSPARDFCAWAAFNLPAQRRQRHHEFAARLGYRKELWQTTERCDGVADELNVNTILLARRWTPVCVWSGRRRSSSVVVPSRDRTAGTDRADGPPGRRRRYPGRPRRRSTTSSVHHIPSSLVPTSSIPTCLPVASRRGRPWIGECTDKNDKVLAALAETELRATAYIDRSICRQHAYTCIMTV